MNFINLDELARRVSLITKPTPYHVLRIIQEMRMEITQ